MQEAQKGFEDLCGGEVDLGLCMGLGGHGFLLGV